MTQELAGRMVISCDRCNARLDLGPANRSPYARRMPSGWISIDEDKHVCGLCSPGYTSSFLRRFS